MSSPMTSGQPMIRDGEFRKATFTFVRPHLACVEVAVTAEAVQVRDSKCPFGAVLYFTHDEWEAFVQGVKNEEFNL